MSYNIKNVNMEIMIVSLIFYRYIDRANYKLKKEMFTDKINASYIEYIFLNGEHSIEELNQSFISIKELKVYTPEVIEEILKIFKIKTVFEIFYKKSINLLWQKAQKQSENPNINNLEYINKTIEEFKDILASLENEEDNRTPAEKYRERIFKIREDVDSGIIQEGFYGLSTGIGTYDELLKGLKPGTYNLLAGRPSMGKTSLALDIVATNIKEGKNILVFSLEMPAEDIIGRLIPKIDKNLTINQSMNGEDITNDVILNKITNALEYIEKSGLEIVDFSNKTKVSPADLEKEADLYMQKNGHIDLIILDYIQLLTNTSNKDENSIITLYSGQIQRLTKKTNSSWIVLSQLNRDLEKRNNKRPMLSDLRGSGSLEQDADTITFVYRDAVYAEIEVKERLAKKPDDKIIKEQLDNLIKAKQNSAEIIVAKNRNGATGTSYDVVFYKPTATYSLGSNMVECVADLCESF